MTVLEQARSDAVRDPVVCGRYWCTQRGSLHGRASASAGDAAGPAPTEVIPLFSGGTFDAAYNSLRPTLRVRTPKGTARALLEAVITGAFSL